MLTYMNNLGRAYLASEPALAEPVLREALAGWMRKARDDWHTYEAASLLGGFLLIRKDYAGAEPYLLQGYEGLKAREARIPAPPAGGSPRPARGSSRSTTPGASRRRPRSGGGSRSSARPRSSSG